MFELFELIVTSPAGAFAFARLQDALYAVIVISDCDDCGFKDLGRLLFGGVVLAILAGVGISVLLRHLNQKALGATASVSIRPTDTNDK